MDKLHPKRFTGSMRKAFPVVALTVLTSLALSGCSGAAAPSTTSNPEPANTQTQSAITVQKIDAEHQASLLEEFRKIDPALDSRRSIQKARQQCRMILLNEPEEEQIAFAKDSFEKVIIKPVESPDETAKKIIAVIKSNGFCKAAE